MKRRLFWLLAAVTAAVYGIIVGWSLPFISSQASGLAPFDMRPTGYSFEEARSFLATLTPEGTEFYRNVQHRLDIVFPLLQATTLYLALAALLSPQFGRSRWLWLMPVFLVAIFDWAENVAVAKMLAAGAGALSPELVADASRWSVLKSGVTTVAFVAVLAALAWRGLRAYRIRRTADS
jgi:hypothetical protein